MSGYNEKNTTNLLGKLNVGNDTLVNGTLTASGQFFVTQESFFYSNLYCTGSTGHFGTLEADYFNGVTGTFSSLTSDYTTINNLLFAPNATGIFGTIYANQFEGTIVSLTGSFETITTTNLNVTGSAFFSGPVTFYDTITALGVTGSFGSIFTDNLYADTGTFTSIATETLVVNSYSSFSGTATFLNLLNASGNTGIFGTIQTNNIVVPAFISSQSTGPALIYQAGNALRGKCVVPDGYYSVQIDSNIVDEDSYVNAVICSSGTFESVTSVVPYATNFVITLSGTTGNRKVNWFIVN